MWFQTVIKFTNHEPHNLKLINENLIGFGYFLYVCIIIQFLNLYNQYFKIYIYIFIRVSSNMQVSLK